MASYLLEGVRFLTSSSDIFLVDHPFSEASAQDPLLEKVSLVLCSPISTLSAVSNPIDYLLQEGGQLYNYTCLL